MRRAYAWPARWVLLALLATLAGCGSQPFRLDLRDEQAIASLGRQLERDGQATRAGWWHLVYGAGPKEAGLRFERALVQSPADPEALLGAFLAADLRLDEAGLVALGQRLLAVAGDVDWPVETRGYLLLRLSRSPLTRPGDATLQATLADWTRRARIPYEVAAVEGEARHRPASVRVTGRASGTPLVDFSLPESRPGQAGDAPAFEWRPAEPLPAELPVGVYRLDTDTVLAPGVSALVLVRSRNAVRLLGLKAERLEANPPDRAPRAVEYLQVTGTGRPVALELFWSRPDPGFSFSLLPLPANAVPTSCGADRGALAPIHALACAELALAVERPEAAWPALADRESPPHQALAAAVAMHGMGGDSPVAREAFRRLTAALESMPALSLGHLLLARWFERAAERDRALGELAAGRAVGDESPAWWLGMESLYAALELPREAAQARTELSRRWPGLEQSPGLRLPWEAALPGRSVPPEADGLRPGTSPAGEAPEVDSMAMELRSLRGQPVFWRALRTPLNDILAVARAEKPGAEAATILLQETVVTARLAYQHRAVRVNNEEGIRRLGEWRDLHDPPVLLRARAIKPDLTVVFPDDHGSGAVQAFPGLAAGDVLEVEWLEDLAPGPVGARALRVFPLQDEHFLTGRACFTVASRADQAPRVQVEPRMIWLFEKNGVLPDGTPFVQWCSRRVPAAPGEEGMLQPETAPAHAVVYPYPSDYEGFRRVQQELWWAVRASDPLLAAARRLAQVHPADPLGLVREALSLAVERVREPEADPFATPAQAAWETGRGSAATVLVALLTQAGVPARLVFVNPLDQERPTAEAFSLTDYPYAVVEAPLPGGTSVWLDPGSRPALFDWLPSRLRDRRAIAFAFPGEARRVKTPAATGQPDALELDLECNSRCRVELVARGLHKAWVDGQLGPGASEAEVGQWLRDLLGDLLPLGGSQSRVALRALEDRTVLTLEVPLEPGDGRSLLLRPVDYGQPLLVRSAGVTQRRFPFLVEADVNVRLTLSLDGWSVGAPLAVREASRFFEFGLEARPRKGGVVFEERFRVQPQVITPDLYPGFRQNLQAVSGLAPIELRPVP